MRFYVHCGLIQDWLCHTYINCVQHQYRCSHEVSKLLFESIKFIGTRKYWLWLKYSSVSVASVIIVRMRRMNFIHSPLHLTLWYTVRCRARQPYLHRTCDAATQMWVWIHKQITRYIHELQWCWTRSLLSSTREIRLETRAIGLSRFRYTSRI